MKPWMISVTPITEQSMMMMNTKSMFSITIRNGFTF